MQGPPAPIDVLPEARRILALARRDEREAERALAALPLPIQVAVVCEAPAAQRAKLLGLLPAPEHAIPMLPDAELVFAVKASGLDDASWLLASATPRQIATCFDLDAWAGLAPDRAALSQWFAVIAEADGTAEEVSGAVANLKEAMAEGALLPPATITDHVEIRNFWAWRDGVSIAVTAQRGGKISEDVVVPVESLAEAVEETIEIGRRHDLPACSWGHAGDGNLHSSFLVDLDNADQMRRGGVAAAEIFEMAIRLGGSISGEHGIGSLKTGHVEAALGPVAIRLQAEIKKVFDPKLLLNPGKKILLP